MQLAVLITALLSAFCGVASALAMTYGTRSKPWEIQSYKGQSDAEKAFQRKQSRWLGAGIGLLAIAFLFSAASAICSYLAA